MKDLTDANLKTLIVITIIGGVGFGWWRRDVGAGLFAWVVIFMGIMYLVGRFA